MTHCAKCSQPLYLTGLHACSITRGNAVPEVDLLRAEVFRLGGMLDAALLQVRVLREALTKIRHYEFDGDSMSPSGIMADDALKGSAEKPAGDGLCPVLVFGNRCSLLNLHGGGHILCPEKQKCDKQYSLEDSYGYCGREQGHDGDHGRND